MNFFRKKQLQQRLRQDPYYRLQSLEEVSWAVAVGVSIDVNRATVDDWLRLPGISIHQARSLVALTAQGVQFLSVEDVAAALGLPVQRLQPLRQILNFSYYVPEFAPPQIEINRATAAELAALDCISPELADRMVAEREKGGFQDFADLQRRLQLSPEIVMNLLQWLRF